MTSKAAKKSTVFGATAALAMTLLASFAVVTPAHAVCSGAYFSVNTSAQATVKVSSLCTGSSKVRARKDWYYTDSTNSSVGTSVGPWIGDPGLASIVYLPSGRFHKVNIIESN
ncbi:hypothetical protein ET475_00530 [Microbacterium protaetiae]|uniref:Secreted protein n=1 Tax=Microbacterium protaetiae TaxID=2509458 RepID=A0A4P6EAV1_9MICO|nr:hypothetical protein [Microbacterium protaetiae]QAY58636.1 hypothetical protein ET475_00530 [Microbacterium protaetiae]